MTMNFGVNFSLFATKVKSLQKWQAFHSVISLHQQKLAKTANTDKKLSYHKETVPVYTMPAWFNYRA